MGVDKSYGSGRPLSAATSASRRTRANSAAIRKTAIKRQAANYGTPIAKIGRFLSDERVSGIIATAALAAAGIAGIRAQRTQTRTATPGARPMTTAQRSAAVTRAGRNGVGYIGPSIKPRAPRYEQEYGDYPGIADEPFSSYESAYARAEAIYRKKYGKPSPSWWSEGYAGSNYPSRYVSPNPVDTIMSPEWALKTANWRALQGPLRKTASIRKRGR